MLENIAHTDGENTTLMLACATGGATDAKLKAVKFDWEKLKTRLKKPKVGQKDGPYYVRGGELAGERRTTENLLSGELIILDGDSSLDPETGEITPGAPPMASVCDALSAMGITYFAHTSHSFQKGKLEKYRVIIPAKLKSEGELNASVDYLIAQLHAKQIWLADVNENHKWIQPWFFSRVRDEQAAGEFCYREHNGKKFDVKVAVSYAKELAQQEAVEKSAGYLHTTTQNGEGNIQKFNHNCDISYVRSLIEQAGYRFCFYQKGKDAYKYIRPGSESGQPGLTIMRGTQGDWCVYSHHGSGIVPPNRFLDPFALTAIVKHGGDMKAAARTLFPKEPTVLERLSERASMQRESIERASERTSDRTVEPTFNEKGERTLAAERAVERASGRRLELIRASDLVDVPVKWLVEGILPADSFAAIYGKPGSYKSFAALYMSAMIAAGREAFGGATTAGAVVYVACEGSAGLKRRKEALWLQHELPADAPLFFVRSTVNLFSNLDDRDALAVAINELGIKPRLIVIDTMARASNGADENSAKDMGQVVSIMSTLQDEFGSTVMFVHHSSKANDSAMRGSSVLLGAVDAEIECTKLSQEGAAEKIGRLTITKMKDAEDQGQFFFKMETRLLSQINSDASSLALIPIEGEALAAYQTKNAKGKKLTGNQSEAFKALKFAIDSYGAQPNIGLEYAPKGIKAVRFELWIATWETKTALEKEAFKKAKQRTPQMLSDAGHVSIHAGWVWIAENASTKNPASFDTGFPADRKGHQGATFDDIPFS